jgi:hypothetical protein
MSKTDSLKKFTCPCCGYKVFNDPPGSDDICPICFWQDDIVQLRFPKTTGANHVPLIKAQKTFKKFKVSEYRYQSNVRDPVADDEMDESWRTLNEVEDYIEHPIPGVDYGTTYPNDPTALYYWSSNFWRSKDARKSHDLRKIMMIKFSRLLKIILLVISVFVTLSLSCAYFLFFYQAPPQRIGNHYLQNTESVKVYKLGNLIHEISDPDLIQSVIEGLQFTKLPSGYGMLCATEYRVDFISQRGIYSMYFQDCDSDSDSSFVEMSFAPDINFNAWEKLTITAGTIVPIYTTELSREKCTILLE